ncbi:MAG: dTDP-6-deoxy-3,4-keto-hexulose isomerase [Microgenomates group bacterium GW2011_GWF1_46_12]|nr:MAG: dTDP-6-deoxy-3,4-keto-hexulose isomerase [Microgenomates group bacterium GW2011_GWF1_46_12]
MRYKLFSLKNIQAPNFSMTALELKEYIDFPVKRIYFISHPKGDKNTGSHCHLQDETEMFIQVAGSCTIVVDDGGGLTDIQLNSLQNAIYIPTKVWHHFKNMSYDCIILALTSTNYDPARTDYCENYEEFQKLCPKS